MDGVALRTLEPGGHAHAPKFGYMSTAATMPAAVGTPVSPLLEVALVVICELKNPTPNTSAHVVLRGVWQLICTDMLRVKPPPAAALQTLLEVLEPSAMALNMFPP